jgi:hypothetical protein
MLTLSVEEVNLRTVLAAVSEKASITVKSPGNLEKPITIEFHDIPLEQGLRRILRGVSYALIYAPGEKKDVDESVSGVFVLSEHPTGPRTSRRGFTPSARATTDERRKTAHLERYERRLDALEQRMAMVDRDSPQGKALSRQIILLEKHIEKLLQD